MTHTVTITRLPDDDSDDYESTFGGTHGSDCEVLMPCRLQRCQRLKRDYTWGDERTAHGVLHEYRDGEWLVSSDICALGYVFEFVTESETFEGIPIGTYPVRIEWEDDRWWMEVQCTRSGDPSLATSTTGARAERGTGRTFGHQE